MEYRSDKHDENKKNLPCHADGGIGGVIVRYDEVPHQNMIDNAMRAIDEIEADQRPCEFPDRPEPAAADYFQVKRFQKCEGLSGWRGIDVYAISLLPSV